MFMGQVSHILCSVFVPDVAADGAVLVCRSQSVSRVDDPSARLLRTTLLREHASNTTHTLWRKLHALKSRLG